VDDYPMRISSLCWCTSSGIWSWGMCASGLLADWYSGPSRLAWRLMVGLPARVLGFGRHPRLVQGLLVGGSAVAIARGLAEHAWLPVAVLTAVLLATMSARIADAARSREAERAADRFAADHGAAGDLAHALTVIGTDHVPSHLSAVLADHPTRQERLNKLLPGTGRAR
jgi:hypothetical protein